jgi:iron(III) transport system ATP-binding protein
VNTLLKITDAECRYHGQTVVQGLSLHVNKGSLVGLLGPSGCGKTTILRAIAGFEPLYRGNIQLHGETVSRTGFTLAPDKRRLGMVFQDYALFPHMNVIDNICFGLRKPGRTEKEKTAARLLEIVGLEQLGQRFPHELSGGQQQRVALARALAPQPELVLLDEPFSNLDVDMRERLSFEVRDILKNQGITGIIVTHDQNEAFAIGDQVGVMKDGRILQWDTPYNLYHEPGNRFVADFIGQGKFLRATLLAPDTLETETGLIRGNRAFAWPRGTEVDVLLRPDDVIADPDGELVCEVTNKAFKGAEILYTLRLPTGSILLSLFPSHLNHEVGEQVRVRIAADHLVAFPLDPSLETVPEPDISQKAG